VGAKYQTGNDSTHFFPEFLREGYQILIYSGNSDAVVPFAYSRYCINDLFNNFGTDVTKVREWSTWGQLPSK